MFENLYLYPLPIYLLSINIYLCFNILALPDFLTWVLNVFYTANSHVYADLHTMHQKQLHIVTYRFYVMPVDLLPVADNAFMICRNCPCLVMA